jgi:hypothetical protein
MANIFEVSWETYKSNLRLMLLFSIPFVIAALIPLLAPLPTYVSVGAIFIRTASAFTNLNPLNLAVIVVSGLFSLLFISFGFVAISLLVKSKRTHTKVSVREIQGIEKYIVKVYLLLLAYAIVLVAGNIFGYYYGNEAVITDVIGLFGFIFLFYAPTAIVIDNRPALKAIKSSLKLVVHSPQYILLWLISLTLIISVLDLVFIAATGTFWSRYIMLVVSSVLLPPFFIIFLAEAYMKRFPLLKH